MKTTQSIAIILFVLLTAQIASAYYCPSTGRWLSRDPIAEPGFQALQTTTITPHIGNLASSQTARWIQRDSTSERNEPNIYCFVGNNPVGGIDLFGLETVTVGYCEVLVLFGHGSETAPHTFVFPNKVGWDGPSYAGWFVGCYSKITDDKISYPIPGAPSTSGLLYTGAQAASADPDESFDLFLRDTMKAATEKAKEIACKCTCSQVKLTQKLVAGSWWENRAFPSPKSEIIKCDKK